MNEMKEGTKMLLVAFAVLICSLGALYFISFSESPDVVVVAVFAAVAGECHLLLGLLCLVVAAVVIIVAIWREKNSGQEVILLAILFLPMVFLSPLSRHNNANFVERDKAIAAGIINFLFFLLNFPRNFLGKRFSRR